ncbi:MAG: sugar-binding protein [Bacillota bacterium]
MKRLTVLLTILFLMVLCVSAIPGGAKSLTIAMIPKALDNPVFLDAKEGGEKAAKELGVEFIWTGPTTADAAGQVTVIEGLIQKKVDGIIVSCCDAGALKDVIDRAVAAGIVVATFDSDSPESKRAFYCGTDNYKAGRACGEYMIQLAKERKLQNTTLECAILTGGLGAFNLNERIRGFKEACQGQLKLKYLSTMACDDDINRAVELTEQCIKAHPNLKAFFFAGAWPFFSKPGSMPNLKAWVKKGGLSVSMDTFYPVLVAMKDGLVNALVGQDFVAMGDLGVRRIVDVINGKSVPKFIDTGLEKVDKSNFDKVFASKKPW